MGEMPVLARLSAPRWAFAWTPTPTPTASKWNKISRRRTRDTICIWSCPEQGLSRRSATNAVSHPCNAERSRVVSASGPSS